MNSTTLETRLPAMTSAAPATLPAAPASGPVSGASGTPAFAQALAQAAGDRPLETVRGSDAAETSTTSEGSSKDGEAAPAQEVEVKKGSDTKVEDAGDGDLIRTGSLLSLGLLAAVTATPSAPANRALSAPTDEGKSPVTRTDQGLAAGASRDGAGSTGAVPAGTAVTMPASVATPKVVEESAAGVIPEAGKIPAPAIDGQAPGSNPAPLAAPLSPVGQAATEPSGKTPVKTGTTAPASTAAGERKSSRARSTAVAEEPARAGLTAAPIAGGTAAGTGTKRVTESQAPGGTVEAAATDPQPSPNRRVAGHETFRTFHREAAPAGAGPENAAGGRFDGPQVTLGHKDNSAGDGRQDGKHDSTGPSTGEDRAGGGRATPGPATTVTTGLAGLSAADGTTGAAGTATAAAALAAASGTEMAGKTGATESTTGTAGATQNAAGRQGSSEGTHQASQAGHGLPPGVSREAGGVAADRAVEQVVRSARLLGTGRLSEMRIRLDPPGMGEITLRLRAGRGEVWASAVASPETARALRDGADSLGRALEAHGLALTSFKVTETAPGQALTATGGHGGFTGSGWGGPSDGSSDRNPGRQAPEAYSLWNRTASGPASFRQMGPAALAGQRRLDRVL